MDVGWKDSKRVSDLEDVREAGIQLATLDSSYIGAVKATLERKPFLRDATFHAQLTDRLTEGEMAV